MDLFDYVIEKVNKIWRVGEKKERERGTDEEIGNSHVGQHITTVMTKVKFSQIHKPWIFLHPKTTHSYCKTK
jgi:hypothetical protein